MRSRVETVCGAIALTALILLGVRALRSAHVPALARANVSDLGRLLPSWTVRPSADSLHVEMSAQSAPVTRDWLRALRSAGTPLNWSGDVPPAAVEAEWEPGLAGAALIRVAGTKGAPVTVGDGLGTMDSARVDDAGVEFRLPAAQRDLRITVGNYVLHRRPERETSHRVAVLASADWESRFVMAALESAGWAVDARLRVGPDAWIVQGRPLPLDTARHGAAIVFSTPDAAAARAVREFVKKGGGLVLAGGTLGFDALAPGRLGTVVRSVAGLSVPDSRDRLEYRPIIRLEKNAGVLDASRGGVRAAARRVGAGRVVMLGDAETWRLALGSDRGLAEHADLWGRAVALVSPHSPARSVMGDDVAPRAALVAALGSAREAAPPGWAATVPWEQIVGVLLFAALIAEWAARRMRGAA